MINKKGIKIAAGIVLAGAVTGVVGTYAVAKYFFNRSQKN